MRHPRRSRASDRRREPVGDDVGRSLSRGLGDPLESLRVLALNADEDDQLRVGVAVAEYGELRIGPCEVGVEIAGLGSGLSRGPR